MAYPDTVVVNADGDLLVGLSDGQIVNAGSVRGPAGYIGDRGAAGLRGEPGISCIAAFKAPSQDDGKEGDSWIDCSSAEFAFYKRSGNGWNKIANLRQPAPDRRMGVAGGGGGSSSGGGSGGGAEVHVSPNSPAFPNEGDLWFKTDDIEDGRLYIYVGDTWQPVLPQPDLDGYAKTTYVDAKTASLPYRIETDKVLRDGKLKSSTAEIQLVDNDDNFTNVKFTGLNGIGVTSDQQGIMFDGAALLGDITVELDDYATKQYSDAQDQDLQNQINDLSVSKGKVARYTVDNNSGTPVSREGKFATNTSFYSNVDLMSFGIEDADGALTKPMADGDIIESVNPSDGKVNRYKVTDAAGAPTIVAVEYVSGDDPYVIGDEKQFYIYPQNEAGASKEYVDAQDDLRLVKSGDEMTGRLTVKPTSGTYGLIVQPGPDASGATDIFRVRDYAYNQVFYADVSGGVGVNVNWAPTSDNHLVPKKYLEDYVATHGGGGSANVPVQPGAPGGMVVGDMWFDTSTNSLMIKVS